MTIVSRALSAFLVLTLSVPSARIPAAYAESGSGTDASNLYSSGWDKRVPVTIDNSGNPSALTNYQVQVDLTYDADMQTDFDDIRFTNQDGILLDHWLETKTDADSATFWVEVDFIPASGNSTIYAHYGSGSAVSTSDGDETFLLFDDFTTGTTQGMLTASGKQFLFEGTGSGDWLGRPYFAEHDGVWMMVYRQTGTHGYDADAVQHIRFSDDEGATWTDADTYLDGEPVIGAPFQSRDGRSANIAIIMEMPNGDLILHDGTTQSNERVAGSYQYRSTDGGATWTDEGFINNDVETTGGQDYTVVGNDVYATFWKDEGNDGQPYQSLLYKSSDNGFTWTLVSEITQTSEGTSDEVAIQYLGGTTLLAVMRNTTSKGTHKRVSTDLGQTWGELTDIFDEVRVLQRPRMRIFPDEPDRIYLYGRDHNSGARSTVVYYSDDDGDTWSNPFYPDASTYSDTGYTDMLKRSDGTFYMASYAGTHSASDIIEYTFGFEESLGPDPEKWENLNALATISDSQVTYKELNTRFGELGVLKSATPLTRPFIAEMDMNVLSFDHVHLQFGPTPHAFTSDRDAYTWWIDIDDPSSPKQDLRRYENGTIFDVERDVEVTPDIANGERFDQRFVFSNSGITVFTNGTAYIDAAAEPAYSSGYIGLSVGAKAVVAMDTIKVRAYAGAEPSVSVGAEESMTPAVPCLPTDAALAAYWKYDEAASGTFTDSSGSNNNGTGMGPLGTNSTPQPASQKAPLAFANDHALHFDGKDDRVHALIPDAVAGPQTVSLWFNTSTVTGQHALLFNNNALEFGIMNDKTRLKAAGTTDKSWSFANTDGATALATDTWYHLAIISDGSGIHWYLNGELDGTDTSYTGNLNRLGNVYIGARPGDRFTDGFIDDVRIYSRALSESEISVLAAGECEGGEQIAPPPSDEGVDDTPSEENENLPPCLPTDAALAAYWKYDEAASGTFIDSSSSNNDGTGMGPLGTNSTPQPASQKAPLAFANDHALHFDGKDDRVHALVSNAVAGPQTVSLWFNTSTVTGQHSLLFNNNILEFGIMNDKTLLKAAGTADKSWSFANTRGSTPLAVDTWYHLAIVSDGSGIHWYLNGELDGTDTSYTGNLNRLGNVYIGARPGDRFTDGYIDDVRIYSRALSESEISVLAAGECEHL